LESKCKVGPKISGSTLRLQFNTTLGGNKEESNADENAAAAEESKAQGKDVKVSVQILKVNDNKHCVKFTYKDPQSKVILNGNTNPEIIQHFWQLRNADELRIFCDTTFDEGQ